MATQMQKK